MITANNKSQSSTAPTAYESASGNLSGASDIYAGLNKEGSLANINKYINPYYQNVMDTVLGRMKEGHTQDMMAIGDQASAAGAFGGSRHGVVEGMANRDYNRNVSDTMTQISSQAFESAADRAYRDKVTAAQGMTGLGNDYFNIGRTLGQDQMDQGNMQQNLLQQILSGTSGKFQDWMNEPYKAIDMFKSLLGADARRGNATSTQQSTPGLYDYLALAAQAYGGS